MSDDRKIPGEFLARLARHGRVYLLDSLPSTNDYAFTLADKLEPAVVIAYRQTRGKGRFRRDWYSDTDSLTFSLLLFQGEPEDPVPATLTQLVGLAVCHAVRKMTGLHAQLRWPNDIVVDNHKVAGILCEQRKEAIVVGMGVNVNQSAFPEELNLPEAASLRMLSDREWEKLELLDIILEEFADALRRARDEQMPQLMTEIKNLSSVLHKRVEVRTMFRRHIGTVVDIDAEGRIVLRSTNGKLVVINTGQARGLQ